MQRTQLITPRLEIIPTSFFIGMISLLSLVTIFCMSVMAQPFNVTDEQITLELRRKLIEDELVSGHLIDIETTNGIVTLSGTVDNLVEKARAISVAENMKGVLDVIDELDVMPVVRTDAEILQDVETAFALDPATDTYEITVAVNNGVVSLTGTVESVAEKKIATQVAEGVKGVKEVVNNLDVTYPTVRSDLEIEAEIERRLELNTEIKESLIDVRVQDGTAILSGTVGSVAERTQAISAAWVNGVTEVDSSQLVIEWETVGETIETPTIMTDAEIEQAVEDALLYEPRVISTDVNVNVENNVVTLTGTVDSYNAKWIAGQTAEDVANVRRVKNYLLVRFEEMRDDAEIAQDVRDALMRDPLIEAFDITVEVINGNVYLRGIVDYYSEKQQAEDVASRVNGVVDVQNNLKIDSEMPAKSDQQIREDIESEYFWSPFVDGSTITVMVDNGMATLSGEVNTWAEHKAAVDNAFDGGATSVKSYLDIKEPSWESETPRYYNRSVSTTSTVW